MIFLRTYNFDKNVIPIDRPKTYHACQSMSRHVDLSRTRLARANVAGKNILSRVSPLTLSVSLLAGHGSRLRRPDTFHYQIIHFHLQESKTMRCNPGYSNPFSQHWDHIITTSITRRTVRPWLVMMMTSKARVQWHGRIVFIIVSDTSVITWPATVKLVGDSPMRDKKKLPTASKQETGNENWRDVKNFQAKKSHRIRK